MKKNKLRIILYLVAVFIFIIAVIVRQSVIATRLKGEAVTVYGEWKHFGKPIVVEKVKLRDVKIFEKVTVLPLSKEFAIGYVPKNIQRNIRPGQAVEIENNDERFLATVISASEKIDMNTGMYPIEIRVQEEMLLNSNRYIAHIHYKTLENVFIVSDDVVRTDDDGQYFVWIVNDGKAKKKIVEIGNRDGYGIQIKSGLSIGDAVVIEGYTKLLEEDTVQMGNFKE